MTLLPAFLRATVLCALLLPGTLGAQGLAMDTVPISAGRYAEASTLLQKTIFRVDVARLRLRFGVETALGLESLLDGRRRSEALADSAVELAVRTTDAWAGLTFQRDVDFQRFLDGIRDGVDVAREAGFLDPVFAQRLSDSLPAWYASLLERGVREGDAMTYRITGDSLRTVFRTADGRVLVDQVDVGPQTRLSVMGGFLARGSDFRKGLLNSLFGSRGEGAAPPGPAHPLLVGR